MNKVAELIDNWFDTEFRKANNMPNPSEMQRDDEEAFEKAQETAYNLDLGKSERQAALTEVRRLGKLLGYNTKPYNGHSE